VSFPDIPVAWEKIVRFHPLSLRKNGAILILAFNRNNEISMDAKKEVDDFARH